MRKEIYSHRRRLLQAVTQLENLINGLFLPPKRENDFLRLEFAGNRKKAV